MEEPYMLTGQDIYKGWLLIGLQPDNGWEDEKRSDIFKICERC